MQQSVGGNGNTISASTTIATSGCTIAGGLASTITDGLVNTIGGGQGNSIVGDSTGVGAVTGNVIAGGQNNQISISSPGESAVDNAIAGGNGHQILGAELSFIAGGLSNKITGDLATNCNVGGGNNNQITAGAGVIAYSNINGGQSNLINWNASADVNGATIGGGVENSNVGNPYQTIGGGNLNSIDTAIAATIAGGQSNAIVAGAQYSFVGGGQYNTGSGEYSTVGGGLSNTVNNNYASIPGGREASTRSYGAVTFASGKHATEGDCQTEMVTFRRAIVNAAGGSNYELFLDGNSAQYTIPENSVVTYRMLIHVVETSGGNVGSVGSCVINGTVKRLTGNNVTNVGAPDRHVMEDNGGFDADVGLDTTNQAIYPFIQIPNSVDFVASATATFIYTKF